MSTYNIETEAQTVFDALVQDINLDLPAIDLDDPQYSLDFPPGSTIFEPVKPLDVADLTTRVVGGSGVFDALMDAFKAHLRAEYDNNRITGADYAKAYVSLTTAAMANAVQFLLSKDQSFWQSQNAQIAAVTANVGLATSKMQFAIAEFQAQNEGAQYTLTKSKLATESVNYGIATYNINSMLPAQLLQVQKQTEQAAYNINNMLPAQLLQVQKQTELATQQISMTKEQTEAARAQTMETRTDGSIVKGSVGKQKELYSQQITSYMRSDERSAAKMFSDTWVAMKTIDEGLTAPDCFTNSSIDGVMKTIITNNNLD